MQSKKYVQSPQIPVFNIRKVNKKIAGLGKNLGEGYYYTPQTEHEKIIDTQNHSNIFQQNSEPLDPRRQKEIMLDQTVNEAIINSKAYIDLKKSHLENKKKNSENKQNLELSIQKQRTDKKQLQVQKEKLISEKKKYLEAISSMKQKITAIRQTNERYKEALNNCGRMGSEQADYISNLVMSMRFQAEYEHNVDPDQMTYEELLELGEKIGSVCRGLPTQVISAILQKIQITSQMQLNEEDKCMVCISSYQKGEIKTILPNCKHQFHYQCLESWLGKQKICPLCKRQILYAQEQQQNPEQSVDIPQN